MSRDRLKGMIGEALATANGREALVKLLRGASDRAASRPRRADEKPAARRPAGAPDAVALSYPTTWTGSNWFLSPPASSDDVATTSASLQTMLNTAKDAIIAIDSDGGVLSANASAGRLFGLPVESLLGESIGERLPSLPLTDAELTALVSQYDEVDGLPELVEARRADGESFTAELTVGKVEQDEQSCFVLCVRDVTERLQDLQSLRDSEARYRALVENAPEAILVLDVDRNRFVDANENAVRLFKMTRMELLANGPEAISPERQADGSPSFGTHRGYIERALNGGRPVFEWVHCDSEGQEFPCEVRFIRLPSSKRRLIRASVIDIIARQRADTLAFGERKLLELIVENAPLDRLFRAAVRLAEQLHADARVAVMLYDEAAQALALRACGHVDAPLRDALRRLTIGDGAGPCANAALQGRQTVVRDLRADEGSTALCELARESGVVGACSTPIFATGGSVYGTLCFYFSTARGPTTEELDLIARLTQIIGIAVRRKQDEAALRESEARFRALFDNVVDGVFQMTLDGRLISANPALVGMLGFDSFEELGDASLADFCVDASDHERLVRELTAYGRVRNYEYRLKHRDGPVMVVVQNSRLVEDDIRGERYCEGTITDVTQRKAAERALFEEKERAEVTLKSIGDAVVTTDSEGKVVYMNPVAEQITGWPRREAYHKPIELVIELKNDSTGEAIESPVLRCLREARIATLAENAVLLARDGSSVAIQDSAAPIRDREGNVVGAVLVFHDVSQERQLHRKLAYHASHDSLTSLINRREFEERLSCVLRSVAEAPEKQAALLYMDLDQFKVVNDTCGHAAGDLLLRQLAEILQSRVRASDVVARMGGDEFAVLLADCTTDKATEIADTLRQTVADYRFAWQESSMQIGVSIGIVPITAESNGIGGLFAAADVACYVAKDLGRNRIHIYEAGDAEARHQEMQWVSRINRAFEQERFELYFQPIVPIGSTERHMPQFELLLRMRGEHGELVHPTTFIPAAERYNLMPTLDRWVIAEALEALVYRPHMTCEPYSLAVNISGTTLNDAKFLEDLQRELSEMNLVDGTLCFEITETAAINNLGRTIAFMRALKARGCRFSLDDFGTGLSSLTYLKNLPVDYVKIDGHFIRNVTKDAADQTVVEAIARMATAFEIETIAERVESGEVFTRLGEIGIGFAQGFFIAVPRPVSDLPIHSDPDRLQA